MTHPRKISLILVILVLLTRAAAYADNPIIKLSRGLTNIVASPGEYLIQYKVIRGEYNPVLSVFAAGMSGTLHMFGRILLGGYDIVTFLIPLPPGYEPLYRPATFFEALKEVDGTA